MLNKTLVVSLILLASAAPSLAQKSARKQPVARQVAVVAAVEEPATDPAQFRRDFIKATEEYRDSLKALATSHEKPLKRLAEQRDRLKPLHDDGIISRRAFEAAEAALADARAKFEDAEKQLATTEAVLAAALKAPARPPTAIAGVEIAGVPVVRSWSTGNKGLDNLIRYYGNKHGVDPYLVYCVMHQESRFGSGATSYKGAMGLMQLMPGTAARYGVTNPYDPAQNVQAGTRYLRDLLRLFNGRVDLALAGYNAGEGAVMKYGNRIPPYRETQNYVRTIGTRYGGGAGVKLTTKTYEAAPRRKGKGD